MTNRYMVEYQSKMQAVARAHGLDDRWVAQQVVAEFKRLKTGEQKPSKETRPEPKPTPSAEIAQMRASWANAGQKKPKHLKYLPY